MGNLLYKKPSRVVGGEARPCAGTRQVGRRRSQRRPAVTINIGEVLFADTTLFRGRRGIDRNDADMPPNETSPSESVLSDGCTWTGRKSRERDPGQSSCTLNGNGDNKVGVSVIILWTLPSAPVNTPASNGFENCPIISKMVNTWPHQGVIWLGEPWIVAGGGRNVQTPHSRRGVSTRRRLNKATVVLPDQSMKDDSEQELSLWCLVSLWWALLDWPSTDYKPCTVLYYHESSLMLCHPLPLDWPSTDWYY
jgi:hypothetical protein